jgi:hypothetical protein
MRMKEGEEMQNILERYVGVLPQDERSKGIEDP